MHSGRLEPTNLISVGKRITYQATGASYSNTTSQYDMIRTYIKRSSEVRSLIIDIQCHKSRTRYVLLHSKHKSGIRLLACTQKKINHYTAAQRYDTGYEHMYNFRLPEFGK